MTKSKIAVVAVAALVLTSAALAATFVLTKTGETTNTITFSYPAQPGADGYRYYAPGTVNGSSCSGTRVSRTFDPSKLSVKFAKVASGTYCVEAIVFTPIGAGQYASSPTPGAPTATFTVSPTTPLVNSPVTFDWVGSCAAGGCTQVWEDEGPDGPGGTDYPLGTGDPLVRTFAVVGTKYVHLVVTDSLSRTAESRQQVVVSDGMTPTQCSDGIDNDGDGKIDLADPGCAGASDNDETDSPPPPSGTCDLNATTSTFAAQVSAAAAGQTVCLASGNYGTWTGVSKAITVAAASGATPQMQVNFGSGASGFTLSGMTGMGGAISGGANNLTIRNSTFTDTFNISGGSTDGIVLDGNTHNWNVGPSSGGPNAKLYLENSLTGTFAAPSVTVRNSQFKNGDLDGIHFGGGSGYQILNNTFDNLCDQGANHTDNMQFDTSVTTQVRIAGNYVHAPDGCGTQGITSYDHGTNGVVIENNVVDIRRPWGIELYSDVNSIVRHNTLAYYPSSQCDFNTPCGRIDIDRKSADPAGTGTQVYDNLAVVEFNAGSTGTAHHNVSSQNAVYVGPLTFHDGFLLAASSPVGKGAASDGTDVGVYANGS